MFSRALYGTYYEPPFNTYSCQIDQIALDSSKTALSTTNAASRKNGTAIKSTLLALALLNHVAVFFSNFAPMETFY